MKDEIKRKIKGYVYNEDDEKKILDYITNLQKENERKERLITQYGEGMCAYANRIDKAIEYIKEDMYVEPKELYGLVDGEHLLNILQGKSDE